MQISRRRRREASAISLFHGEKLPAGPRFSEEKISEKSSCQGTRAGLTRGMSLYSHLPAGVIPSHKLLYPRSRIFLAATSTFICAASRTDCATARKSYAVARLVHAIARINCAASRFFRAASRTNCAVARLVRATARIKCAVARIIREPAYFIRKATVFALSAPCQTQLNNTTTTVSNTNI